MRRFIIVLSVAGACGPLAACNSKMEDPNHTGTASESIIAGTVMTPQAAATQGLVFVNGSLSCSGVLIDNNWALTAQHCAWSPGVAQTALQMTVEAADQSTTIPCNRFYSFGPEDVLLLHLQSPMPVNGSTTGFQNTLFGQPTSVLNPVLSIFQSLNCMGQGQSSIGPSGTGAGTWRSAVLPVTSTAPDTISVVPNPATGAIVAPGDSGGPCFYNGAIAGITSANDVTCGGTPCLNNAPGAVALAAQMTSVSFLAPWINGIMSGRPAIQGPVLGVPAVIQSTYGTTGNFELVAPTIDGRLAHYWRNNDSSILGTPVGGPTSIYPWALSAFFGDSPGHYDGVALTESVYSDGPYLEAVATSGGRLYAFHRGPGSQAPWSSSAMLVPGSANEEGQPAVVKSTYNSGCGQGNLEVAVANHGSGVDYFWRDNCTAPFTWHQSPSVATNLGHVFGLSMVESHYGTIELVVEVAASGCETTTSGGLCLYHLTRDAFFNWRSTALVTKTAGGPPSLATSNFGVNGNFELAVPSPNGGLDYYFKVNDPTPGAVPWQQASPASQETGFFYQGAVLLESNLGNAPGNMELFAARFAGVDTVPGPIDHTWRPTLNFPTTVSTLNGPATDWRWIGPFEIESP